jgi:hypothetical protein
MFAWNERRTLITSRCCLDAAKWRAAQGLEKEHRRGKEDITVNRIHISTTTTQVLYHIDVAVLAGKVQWDFGNSKVTSS